MGSRKTTQTWRRMGIRSNGLFDYFMKEYTVIVLRGGTTLRFPNTDTGDCEGKEKLMDALEHAEAWNEDDEEWVNNCVRNMDVEYGDQ